MKVTDINLNLGQTKKRFRTWQVSAYSYNLDHPQSKGFPNDVKVCDINEFIDYMKSERQNFKVFPLVNVRFKKLIQMDSPLTIYVQNKEGVNFKVCIECQTIING